MEYRSSSDKDHRSDNATISLEIKATKGSCPCGEKAGSDFMNEGRIPVLSCEGSCLRGEIARLAANAVSKSEGFARACHGETLTVPNSFMARWVRTAPKVVVIDGCFLRCHGRVLETLIPEQALVQFDAYSFYREFSDLFEIDSVPEDTRKATALKVAAGVLEEFRCGRSANTLNATSCCCGNQ